MAKRNQPSHDAFLAACNTVASERLLEPKDRRGPIFESRWCRRLMWDRTSVAVVLDNGTTIYAARDAEGNDAGALHGSTRWARNFVLPELNI